VAYLQYGKIKAEYFEHSTRGTDFCVMTTASDKVSRTNREKIGKIYLFNIYGVMFNWILT